MIKVHLDTDLGGDIDDVCALVMLLKNPEVDLTGITVVGDTDGKRTGYVRYVLNIAEKSGVPVAEGARVSGKYYRHTLGIPEEKRYWPEQIAPSPNDTGEALDLLKRSIEQGAVVIGIGPMTNLYLLDKRYPGILRQPKLFVMGGYVFPPRSGFPKWKNRDDFNFQIDVRSSSYVLQNSSPTLIPLSITAETYLRKSSIDVLNNSGKLGQLLAKQARAFSEDEKYEEKYGKLCEKLPNDLINFQHDPLACAVAVGFRNGIEITKKPLLIEEKNGFIVEKVSVFGKPYNIVTKVDAALFEKYWLDTVTS